MLAATTAIGLAAVIGQAPAVAVERDGPPAIDMGALPPDGPPRPLQPTTRRDPCLAARPVADQNPPPPPAQRYLGFQNAWKFSTGAGQRVAVIDTGVARHTRLNLVPGGDYVSGGDGMEDCDIHGTVVAGIIGAKPSLSYGANGFTGVAPDAEIITIRANSGIYQSERDANQRQPGDSPNGYGPLVLLGAAIRHAVDLHATVINISLVSCFSNSVTAPGDPAVGAAVKYAADRNVVVVAAAGNMQDKCAAGNPKVADSKKPGTNLWKNLTTDVSPSWYPQQVLTVGSVDMQGQPSKFTVPGPWLGVAAPGEQIVSLNPNGGLADGKTGKQGQPESLQGTSFASPYVAGIVALVRAAHPELNAYQVMRRIKLTAHAASGGWNPYLGYGIVDPIAAVSASLPAGSPGPDPVAPTFRSVTPKKLEVYTPPPPPDHGDRNTALIGTGAVTGLLALGMLASYPIRRAMQARRQT